MERIEIMEIWDLYDKNRNLTGKTMERGANVEQGLYHLVVEIWTISKDGNMLLTKRHEDKPYGLMWECTGGSVVSGEDSITGALRELREETGLIADDKLVFVDTLIRKHSIVDTYLYIHEPDLSEVVFQDGEVIDAKIVRIEEFKKMNEDGMIVPSVWERFVENEKKLGKYVSF